MVYWLKLIRLFLFGISFWLCLPAFGSGQMADLPQSLKMANELYASTLYDKAIQSYEAILQILDSAGSSAESSNLYPQILNSLGKAHYYIDDYASAYKYFSMAKPLSAKQDSYYFAKVCRRVKNYPEAIEILKDALQDASLSNEHDLKFELALNCYLLGDSKAAMELFESLEKANPKPAFAPLVQIYLARISLSEKKFDQAEARLALLRTQIPQESPLLYELAYLQAKIALCRQDYKKGIDYFKLSLPKHHKEKADWHQDTVYYLGWCYLKMADAAHDLDERKISLEEAEHCFSSLLSDSKDERLILSLAKCYIDRYTHLGDLEACKKADEILKNSDSFSTHETKALALLLRAETFAQVDYLDFSEGIHFAALQGLDQTDGGSNESVLQDQLPVCSASNPRHACLLRNATENLDQALTQMQGYLKEHEKVIESDRSPKFLYLYGALACSLAEQMSDQDALLKAELILQKLMSELSDDQYREACLNLLATFYLRIGQLEKSESAFISLAEKYPNSRFASQALHWAAYCAEKLQRPETLIQHYRQRLFEGFPNSTLAASAYFHYYSMRQYLQGDRIAVKHLESFKDKFDDHPLQITAYYLLGLDYKRERKSAEGRSIQKKNLLEAINSFSNAEALFDKLYKQHSIPEEQMGYFGMIHYRNLLEQGEAYQAIAEDSQAAKRAIYLQYAKELFMQVYRELGDQNHPISHYVKKGHPFPDIQQESLYLLANCYMEGNDCKAARQAIKSGLSKIATAKVSKGYHLSRIHYLNGLAAMKLEEYERALEAFLLAESAGEGEGMSNDQKLDLWIQQSMCYKNMHQNDQAMLILSKVINQNIISSLRVKAMYLRADIYQLQGRHELARKQLEATAKKGGEWAMKAKLKLEQEYGY